MSAGYDLYVGIDWSGARGPRLPNLKVASCGAEGPVMLFANPDGGHWTRPSVASWLGAAAGTGHHILCGLDFSFCFPWEDRGAYLPGRDDPPGGRQGFWDMVEQRCAGDRSFYGGAFADGPPYGPWFHQRGRRGAHYQRRLRVTEQQTLVSGLGAPESVFNLVGARQVGKSSLAGIRFLRAMGERPGTAVWPFEDPTGADLVFVETFPTAFVRMAGEGAGKVRDGERLRRICAFFGADCTPEAATDDEADALVTAAALRALARRGELWNPPTMSDIVRRTEGWTFGVL